MLLDENVGKLIQTDIVLQSADSAVAMTRTQTHPGQAIVVVDREAQPLGVLPGEILTQLDDAQRSLGSYDQYLASAAIVTPETPLRVALQCLAFDPSIRWQIVQAGDAITGVIPADALLDALRQALAADSGMDVLGEATYRDYSTEPSTPNRPWDLVVLTGMTRIFGESVAPPLTACYRCANVPSHNVSPQDVEERDVLGRALCPHDNTPMILKVPCQ